MKKLSTDKYYRVTEETRKLPKKDVWKVTRTIHNGEPIELEFYDEIKIDLIDFVGQKRGGGTGTFKKECTIKMPKLDHHSDALGKFFMEIVKLAEGIKGTTVSVSHNEATERWSQVEQKMVKAWQPDWLDKHFVKIED